MSKTARETALGILERCRRNQAFADALMGNAVKASQLSPKDTALCAKICYGVLQNAALCDFYIDYYSGEKASKIEPKVRDILRISVYQILFLTKIPSHAAVSEGVELCKTTGFARASGFVNAILRKISNSRDALPQIPETGITEYLSIKYSTPYELTSLFVNDFGADFAQELLAANNAQAPTTIQVNTLKTTAPALIEALEQEGVTASLHTYLPDCLNLPNVGDVAALKAHRHGMFYVQDAAARMAVMAADPKAGSRVLDACAAPGGKSFAAALIMQNKGEITACDIHENKLPRIKGGAKHLGINCIKTHMMDASHPDVAFKGEFDIVLADVPCSGLGVIRKKPDIRYKDISPLENLPKIQLDILNGLASCVKPGGTLIYSTCTVLKRENDDVVSAFLAQNPNFMLESFSLPEAIGKVVEGKITLFPHIHTSDGFFIAKLRRDP